MEENIQKEAGETVKNGAPEPQKKKSHKFLKFLMAILVLLGLGGGAFYKFYWLVSPQYSLDLIRKAVASHNMDSFEKHVDVNSVNTKAIDAMVTATISPDDAKNPILSTMLDMVKNTALPHFNSQMRTYVQTGKFAPMDPQSEGAQITAGMAARTGLENLEITGVGSSERHNDEAVVNCTVRDTKLKKDFTLKVRMVRIPDKTWKLVELANLGEFLAAHDAAVDVELSKLNEPISKEIDKRVELIKDGSKEYKIERIDESVSGIAVFKVKAIFSFKLLDSNVTGVRGNVEFYDENHEAIFSRAFDSEGKDLSTGNTDGIWSFGDQWRLNTFDTMDKKLISADMSKVTTGIVFTAVRFKDGKEIKYLTELPE